MLRLENISKAFGSLVVSNAVTLDVTPGQRHTIIGPNGAGKTTLLRTLAGLAQYKGRLRLNGGDLAICPHTLRAKTISYLPQSGAVHWPMRVRDVAALGRMPFGASLQRLSAQDRSLVQKGLEDCDAAHLADQSATELSGGELSRVLLARVLASATPVILADEPTASLDPAHQINTMQRLVASAQEGRLVVAVSHDIDLAARYATRMIALENGVIVGDGAPESLLDSGVLQRIFGVRFLRVNVDGVSALTIARI